MRNVCFDYKNISLFNRRTVDFSFTVENKVDRISINCAGGGLSCPALLVSKGNDIESGFGVSGMIYSVGKISVFCQIVGDGRI